MSERRSTPPAGSADRGLPPVRRISGARREVSDRVELRSPGGRMVTGWALNQSRGGLRAIVEGAVAAGDEVELVVGEEPSRGARIVWVQEEPDGAIVGLSFLEFSTVATPEPPGTFEASPSTTSSRPPPRA